MVTKKSSILFIDTTKQAIKYTPKGFSDDQLPRSDIWPSDLSGGHRNSPILPFSSPIAAGSSTPATQNASAIVTVPRLLYATMGVQTTPSLIREVSPIIIELQSSSEDEGAANEKNDPNDLSPTDGLSHAFFQTPSRSCRRRVVVESDEEDEDPSQSIPGAYPHRPPTPTLTIIERPARTIPNVPPYWLLEVEANLTPNRPATTYTSSSASESPTALEYFTRVGGRSSIPKRRSQGCISPAYEAGSSDGPCGEIDEADE